MHKLKYLTMSASLAMVLLLAGQTLSAYARPLAATSPTLGAAASYSVLAGSIATNTGPTFLSGDLGISPSIGTPPHYTGFPPGIVGGTIHDADATAGLAQAADTAAFTTLDQPCNSDYRGTGQKDLTLVSPLGPGVYCADSFALSGNLTLTGTTGVWIFKATTTLITSPGSSVTGGDPCNVWWRVGSSATLDTSTVFIGNILVLNSISMNAGAILNGRALAQVGAVTMITNTISGPICSQSITPTVTVTPSVTITPSVTVTPAATLQPTPKPTERPTAQPTWTPTALPTAIATATKLPTVAGLPKTGAAPIRNEELPWSLIILGGFSAIALVYGARKYRRSHPSKR